MSRAHAALVAAVILITLPSVGCGGEPDEATSLYALPSSWDELSQSRFFEHPWPSDLRLVDGRPRWVGYPDPNAVTIYQEYVATVEPLLDGFSPVGAGYVRFSSAIDPGSLPQDPIDALSPLSSVQLVDVDPASPERGQRRLVSLRWQEAAGVYWHPNTLAFMPTLGFPLRARTRYALVVTDSLRSKGGGSVAASDELTEALGLVEPTSDSARAAAAALAPSIAELEAIGVAPERIAHLAVFTTNDPTEELYAARDALFSSVAAPTFRDAWTKPLIKPEYVEYQGSYGPSPNFQAGKLPFAQSGDGGAFAFVDGKPTVVDTFDLRFSLSVPDAHRCPMPEAGYPIVLYAHGTGGNYRSYVHDGTAKSLAQRCIATMGIDQIFHGTRPGAPDSADSGQVEVLFFNFQNVTAGRTNPRQAALDEVQRARLFTESHATVPERVSFTSSEIRFDPSKVMFFGHSQGGLNGPMFLAADSAARGAVLSGSSSMLSITLLEKTKPAPSVAALVRSVFLGLDEEEAAELNVFHPAISLAQSLVDVTDPIHYAPHVALQPRSGFAPKSVYMTEGVNADGTGDSYSPPHGIEAQAIAMGLPLQLPAQRAIAESSWGGPQPVHIPLGGLSGNLAGGGASGVLAQWSVAEGSDGHFVVFDVQPATLQASAFLRLLADEPVGRVPPP
jgi:predicted esterase